MTYNPDSVIGRDLYEEDKALRRLIASSVDPDLVDWAEGKLGRWGELCGGPVARRAEVIDKNPPQLRRLDRWGFEVSEVIHHPDALASKADLCEAGYTGFRWSDEVVSDPKKVAAASVMGTSFTYMLCQSDTGMACACGMTAGVARIVERFANDETKQIFMERLTTTNFDQQWDGSMFMTERSGGSDLSNTETTAIKDGQTWLLEGHKWFCSNVDGSAILTLARPEGAGEGTKGLGLYLVPAELEDGSRNNISIRRIKDKLGTRSVPTGEVDFQKAVAYEIASPPAGLNQMMEMVNVSRLGVALMGVGIARRSIMEASTYAAEREAFGKTIDSYPMVRETLVDLQVQCEAALAMCLEAARLGGLNEIGEASEQEIGSLRILTPVAKIRGARLGLVAASEATEILGGNGYIEDWPMARQLRDAQCHTIWEGTENVNSLDVLRSMAKTQAHEALFNFVEEAAEGAGGALGEGLAKGLAQAREGVSLISSVPQVHARRFANLLCDIAGGALLARAEGERGKLVAERYAQLRLAEPSRFPDPEPFIGDGSFELILRGVRGE